MPGVFITATATDAGKTVTAVALLKGLVAAGVRAVGMKPVSAGVGADGRNEDVVALEAAGNVVAPLDDRNPYRFADPVAPHLAARATGTAIDLAVLRDCYARLAARADVVVVEGAGGALVPLDDRHDMLDIAATLRLPVLLVVGVRLGCLNHARLSALAIRSRGLSLAGWVACRIDPAMRLADENVRWLARDLAAPLIADLGDATSPPIPHAALARLRLVPGETRDPC
jgi:dethiobiotin synthetase